MDIIGLLHVFGIGLLVIGGAVSFGESNTMIPLASLTLAAILGFSFSRWRGTEQQAVA